MATSAIPSDQNAGRYNANISENAREKGKGAAATIVESVTGMGLKGKEESEGNTPAENLFRTPSAMERIKAMANIFSNVGKIVSGLH